ncbi:MAG: CRP/FNR family cyclic AMP-dependent transcriptional regulator, partial [Alteromonadaceae bacterium]
NFIIQGTHGPSFYIILSGQATVWQSGHQVALLKAGQFIGEVGFFCNESRTATVTSLTDMLVLKIDRDSFVSLPGKIRELIKDKVISGLVDRVSNQNKQIISLQRS